MVELSHILLNTEATTRNIFAEIFSDGNNKGYVELKKTEDDGELDFQKL